jgi:hypothetical protein
VVSGFPFARVTNKDRATTSGQTPEGNGMFESLSDRLGKIFSGLTGRGALSAADVDAAFRE